MEEVDLKNIEFYEETEFKETEIGPLPKDWGVVRLGEILFTDRKKIRWQEYDHKIPLVEKISFDDAKIIFRNKKDTKTDLYVSDKGRLIVSKINFHQGAISITQELIAATTHYDFYKVTEKTDIFYLWWFLRSNYFKKLFEKEIKFRGFKKEANLKFIKDFIITLPPLSDQKIISAVLSTIQEAKEKTERVIEATKNLKKSLMKHLFTYGPVPLSDIDKVELKETEIGPLPTHWQVVRLGDVSLKPEYGFTTKTSEYNIGIKILRITDIQNGKVNWEKVPFCECSHKELEKYKLKSGDLLVARIGATTGKTILILNCPEVIFGSYLIRIRCKSNLNPIYLYYFTNYEKYWNQINFLKGGRLKQGINIPILLNLIIPLPPISEQQKIAEILSSVDEKIQKEEERKRALENLFKSMLHNLMTGKIRVRSLNLKG